MDSVLRGRACYPRRTRLGLMEASKHQKRAPITRRERTKRLCKTKTLSNVCCGIFNENRGISGPHARCADDNAHIARLAHGTMAPCPHPPKAGLAPRCDRPAA